MPKLATGDFSPVLYLGLNTAVLAMIVASLLASFVAPWWSQGFALASFVAPWWSQGFALASFVAP